MSHILERCSFAVGDTYHSSDRLVVIDPRQWPHSQREGMCYMVDAPLPRIFNALLDSSGIVLPVEYSTPNMYVNYEGFAIYGLSS